MSLIEMTLLLLGLLIIGVPAIIFCFRYKPKQFKYLSQYAYDEQMINLEFLRRDAIEAATSQAQIDEINERYDAQEAQYKIRR